MWINSNKNLKLILVSKKDGTKIADVVHRTEKKNITMMLNYQFD
jgi:hypothetical protein